MGLGISGGAESRISEAAAKAAPNIVLSELGSYKTATKMIPVSADIANGGVKADASGFNMFPANMGKDQQIKM